MLPFFRAIYNIHTCLFIYSKILYGENEEDIQRLSLFFIIVLIIYRKPYYQYNG